MNNLGLSMETDLVVRIERLEDEFSRLIADAGLPIERFVKSRKENCSDHRFFVTYYDQALAEEVMHKDRVIFSLFYRNNTMSESSAGDGAMSDSGMLNKLGELLYEGGRISLAQDVFKEVIRRDPGSSAPYNNLGVTLWRLGSRNQALECFKRALEVDPGNGDAIANCLQIASNKTSGSYIEEDIKR